MHLTSFGWKLPQMVVVNFYSLNVYAVHFTIRATLLWLIMTHEWGKQLLFSAFFHCCHSSDSFLHAGGNYPFRSSPFLPEANMLHSLHFPPSFILG